MEGLVNGKVAIVTGGATGIGEAICKVFARHGAMVIVNGLPGDPVDEVVDEIRAAGGTAQACVADVGTPAGAEQCAAAAVQYFGRLDVLIANAGLFPEHKPKFTNSRWSASSSSCTATFAVSISQCERRFPSCARHTASFLPRPPRPD